MAFARDPATRASYERRAGEYDDWYAGTGRFADRVRPGWAADVARVAALAGALAPARTLDDGSRHRVFKRVLTAEALAGEIGGEPLLDSAGSPPPARPAELRACPPPSTSSTARTPAPRSRRPSS